MDNLTHSLAGAALAKAGLDRHTPLAIATLVLAANAPDIDVLAYTRGPYYALAFRRGITHGLPALLVLPFVIAGVVLAWDVLVRRRRPGAAPARPGAVLALAFVGLVTHPVLDWLNNYGMRWCLPFGGRWSYGDTLFILDPWLWLALGSAVYLGSLWSRMENVAWAALAIVASALVALAPVPTAAEIVWFLTLVLVANAHARVVPATEWGRRRLAAALCIGSTAYCGEMPLSSRLARLDVMSAAAQAGIAGIEDVMVAPVPADPLGARVVIQTSDGYLKGTHHWLDAPRTQLEDIPLARRTSIPEMTDAALDSVLTAAARDPNIGDYLQWSRFPYYRVAEEAGAFRVTVSDVRYDEQEAGSLARVEATVPRP